MTTNQGAIFIADFAGKCIREKVMSKPMVYDLFLTDPAAVNEYGQNACKKYQQQQRDRRTFPYPVKEEQDGQPIPESSFRLQHQWLFIRDDMHSVYVDCNEDGYNLTNPDLRRIIAIPIEANTKTKNMDKPKREDYKSQYEFACDLQYYEATQHSPIEPEMKGENKDVPAIEGRKSKEEILIKFTNSVVTEKLFQQILDAMQAYADQFALPVQPAGVKEDCTHDGLIDTGIGYYHCPACNNGWSYNEWKQLSSAPLQPVKDEDKELMKRITDMLIGLKGLSTHGSKVLFVYDFIKSESTEQALRDVIDHQSKSLYKMHTELMVAKGQIRERLSSPPEPSSKEQEGPDIDFARWTNIDYRWIPSRSHWLGPYGDTYTDEQLYQLYKKKP